MLFNSFEFLVYFVLFFTLYWNIKNVKWQNFLIVVGSLTFYGWWDYRFLFLLLFSFFVDFIIGWRLSKAEKESYRKLLLYVSLITNLSLLGFFKYFNFFIDSFYDMANKIGFSYSKPIIDIILPVGISFYTFQTLSYTIDVYRKKLEPTKDPISFLAFISFFPQLVAGPIERATNLLPQFFKKRKFVYAEAKDAVLQIIWGFFKKVVIADNISSVVNMCFQEYSSLDSLTLIIGVVYFAVQIYCDFSGYSDMAIGLAKLLGFDLMRNFAYPYFSRDISEFWRRWHISLTTWFRDYIYIPLGGSKGGKMKKIRNTMIIFIISGFWHGANWTFVFWGALNALFFLPLLLSDKNRTHLGVVADGKLIPSFSDIRKIIFTFSIACFGWIFFRAQSISEAFNYIKGILMFNLNSQVRNFDFHILLYIPFILLLFIFEWIQRYELHALSTKKYKVTPFWLKISCVSFVLIVIVFGNFGGGEFIYFQF